MKVHFTPALKRFVPNLDSIELQGNTVADIIRNIELAYPDLTDYLRHALAMNGDTLAFGSTTGNLFVSEDRGESWVCLNTHLPTVYSCEFA